ncbi:MAG: chemotaxis protein CheC, partial [Deltaproteobacteria bacterium]|nr:chemotaxis protein CheC [Deltaproteobacteria bacterium]
MDDFNTLSKEQLDALKEVGTIGVGHAANALSQLADRKIMISVPRV